ncbi:unnamed protein product [Closterium sp. Yama58-4]|nr:unnamed protein product [Closterium sp. Yama58-4]
MITVPRHLKTSPMKHQPQRAFGFRVLRAMPSAAETLEMRGKFFLMERSNGLAPSSTDWESFGVVKRLGARSVTVAVSPHLLPWLSASAAASLRHGSCATLLDYHSTQTKFQGTKHLDSIVDEYGRTVLHVAARDGDELVVQALLGLGMPVSVRCNNRSTPMHRAAWGGTRGVHGTVETLRSRHPCLHKRMLDPAAQRSEAGQVEGSGVAGAAGDRPPAGGDQPLARGAP